MITRIEIDGFKSFHDFKMDFTPFTVIAGLNASGKSNLFDALELLSKLAQYSLKESFVESRGNSDELFSMMDNGRCDTMRFAVEMLVGRKIKDNWGIEKEIKSPRLRYELSIKRVNKSADYEDLVVTNESLELIKTKSDKWAKTFLPDPSIWKSTQHGGSKPFIKPETISGKSSIYLRQDSGMGGKHTPANTINQTVLSGVNSNDFPHVFAAKMEMVSWNFMQLNPEVLREPTKMGFQMSDVITHNGGNLAAALYRIKEQDDYSLIEISRELGKFLPEYVSVDVEKDDANKLFIIKLKNKDGVSYSSRVLSEGTLRLLALIIMQFDDRHKGLLCFEEPENGIHPQRLKQMVYLLHDLSSNFNNDSASLRQVIVNTHSPTIIKCLLDWSEDKMVSIFFSKMSTDLFELNGSKVKMRATKINKIFKERSRGLFDVGKEDPRTLAELNDYLDTVNVNDL